MSIDATNMPNGVFNKVKLVILAQNKCLDTTGLFVSNSLNALKLSKNIKTTYINISQEGRLKI